MTPTRYNRTSRHFQAVDQGGLFSFSRRKECRRNGQATCTVTLIEGKGRRMVKFDADSGKILATTTKRLDPRPSRRALLRNK